MLTMFTIQTRYKPFAQKNYFSQNVILFVCLVLAFGVALNKVLENGFNNYLIYAHVFWHAVKQQNLYAAYPAEYLDVNLYGPFFSIVIAPFALLPVKAGAVAWVVASNLFLWFAFQKLPVPGNWKKWLMILCLHELMVANAMFQTNIVVCACIILGFSFIQKNKEGYALFFILAATFIKVYGIVGFAFFFFSNRPWRFIGWAIVWSSVFFFAPLLITSYSFLMQSYQSWFDALVVKEASNTAMGVHSIYQNISVMGMISRIFRLPHLNNAVILVTAALLFISQFSYYRYWQDIRFRLYILSSILIATVIFSTGAESSTYIIAMPGICLWYFLQPKAKGTTLFFIAVFTLTTFAYSDLLTPWSRAHLYMPFSLKALPPFVLWLTIILQVHQKQFVKAILPSEVYSLV